MRRGRTVLAMDCALASAEWQRGRPLNSVVMRYAAPTGRRARSCPGPAQQQTPVPFGMHLAIMPVPGAASRASWRLLSRSLQAQ